LRAEEAEGEEDKTPPGEVEDSDSELRSMLAVERLLERRMGEGEPRRELSLPSPSPET